MGSSLLLWWAVDRGERVEPMDILPKGGGGGGGGDHRYLLLFPHHMAISSLSSLSSPPWWLLSPISKPLLFSPSSYALPLQGLQHTMHPTSLKRHLTPLQKQHTTRRASSMTHPMTIRAICHPSSPVASPTSSLIVDKNCDTVFHASTGNPSPPSAFSRSHLGAILFLFLFA